MGRKRKVEVIESEESAVEKVEVEVMPSCPYCKSEAVTKIKDTDIGALYSCGCGNRFQK